MKEENNEIVSAAETISVDYEEILQRAVAVIENARTSVARHLATKDGKIWLNQQQMAELFATSKQLISHHTANILKDRELNEISVVKQYLTTAADGE